ncbi:MAG: putative methylmalonyl-CoA mutase small subunit [Cohnella sp.]|jgi:methylmalonyl-CoA mutase|nr:putative methylmalonyl-CoA mutase small subunit [Cohnella sp.]
MSKNEETIMLPEVEEESRLFSEFSYPSYEDWEKTVEKVLQGETFEDKLVTETYEGILLQPMYWPEEANRLPHLSALPGMGSFVRGISASGYAGQPWEIAQQLQYPSPLDFNKAARFDLKQGQTNLHMSLDGVGLLSSDPDETNKEKIGAAGVSIFSVSDVDVAFHDIDLEEIPVFIETGSLGLPVLSMMIAHMEHQGNNLKKLRGCIGSDPIGTLVQHGTISQSMESVFRTLGHCMIWAKNSSPELQTVCVRGEVYHDGGASAVEELGFTIATGVEYLRELTGQGMAVDDIAAQMRFSFSIGSNFFMEIAKLRAARCIWAGVIKAFGGSESAGKMYIHGRTSAWTKTLYDPYMNMLRSTTEAFAGIIGGVNSLHVTPFDEVIRHSDGFSSRIAKNTQMILKDEAHLDRVTDPAGGSWYVETLTDALARRAWSLLQEVETKGGILKALMAGFPQERVADTAAKKIHNIIHGIDKVVGTNIFRNFEETPLVLEMDRIRSFQLQRMQELSMYRSSVDQVRLQSSAHSLTEAVKSAPERVVAAAVEAVRCGATLGDLGHAIRNSAGNGEILCIRAIQEGRGADYFEQIDKRAEKGASG